MIRTLQDHGVHQGIDVHMERTILTFLKRVNVSSAHLATSVSVAAL